MIRRSQKDIDEFGISLRAFKANNIHPIAYEISPAISIEREVVLEKCRHFNTHLCFAGQLLMDAYRTDHDDNLISKEKELLFIRSGYFYGATVLYNSFVDYIYVIIYFHYSLYTQSLLEKKGKSEIDDTQDIIDISSWVQRSIKKIIDEYLKQIPEANNFCRLFDDYKNHTKHLRNLANNIKHKAGLSIHGLYIERIGAPQKEINGILVEPNEIVKPIIIDINDEILYLKDVHEKTFTMLVELRSLVNFS